MTDLTSGPNHVAIGVPTDVPVARPRAWGDRLTSTLLFTMSTAAVALFIAEAMLGVLWALDEKFRDWALLLMH